MIRTAGFRWEGHNELAWIDIQEEDTLADIYQKIAKVSDIAPELIAELVFKIGDNIVTSKDELLAALHRDPPQAPHICLKKSPCYYLNEMLKLADMNIYMPRNANSREAQLITDHVKDIKSETGCYEWRALYRVDKDAIDKTENPYFIFASSTHGAPDLNPSDLTFHINNAQFYAYYLFVFRLDNEWQIVRPYHHYSNLNFPYVTQLNSMLTQHYSLLTQQECMNSICDDHFSGAHSRKFYTEYKHHAGYLMQQYSMFLRQKQALAVKKTVSTSSLSQFPSDTGFEKAQRKWLTHVTKNSETPKMH